MDIWAVVIGVVCGVIAGIPTSALIIVALAQWQNSKQQEGTE